MTDGWSSAGTATQNRMLLAEKNHGEQFDRAALDYRNRISSKADAIQSFRILFKRNFHVFRADPKGFKTMVIQIISLTSMYSLLFRDQDRTQDNYTNVVNCIFILCIFLLMIPMNLTVVAFPSEKPIILREVTNGSYDALPFFVAKTIFLCITKGVVPLVVGSVGYFAVGIYPEITLENFLTFLIPIFQMFIWSSMTGYITLINILTIIGTYALLYSRLKITLVRKANVDVAEEEEARLSGFFGQFLQDFKSMCYIFGK
eukprot:gene11580-13681_t